MDFKYGYGYGFYWIVLLGKKSIILTTKPISLSEFATMMDNKDNILGNRFRLL